MSNKEKKKLLYASGVYKHKTFGDLKLPDMFMLFTKDDKGKKDLILNANPTVKVFITKDIPEDNGRILPMYLPKDELYEVTVPYSPRDKMLSLAKELVSQGFESEPYDYLSKFTTNELKDRIFNGPFVHDADLDIEDYFMDFISTKYDNSEIPYTKSFFDIETNGVEHKTFVPPETPLAPVILIGFFISGDFYSFIFRDPLVEDPEMDLLFDDEAFKKKIEKEILEEQSQYGLKRIKFVLYESEKDMIEQFFGLVNTLKPEMLAAWNIAFDIKYLLNRYSVLCNLPELEDIEQQANTFAKRSFFTEEARSIICDTSLLDTKLRELREFLHKNTNDSTLSRDKRNKFKALMDRLAKMKVSDLAHMFYYADLKNNDYADKGDTVKVTAYTNYVDQMLIYANIRKSAKKSSYALDFTAEEELDDRKRPFPKGISINNVFSKAFIIGLKYNVHDVILQHRLEEKNKDLDLVWNMSQNSATRLEKVPKKTVAIRNLARRFFRSQGFILSNNHHTVYLGDKPKTKKVTGGFVGDPVLIAPVGTTIQFMTDLSSRLFENVIDEDLSAQYPSIIIALGIEDPTLLGKVELTKRVKNDDGTFTDEDIARILTDAYISEDYVELGAKFFGLPNLSEMINLIDNEFSGE